MAVYVLLQLGWWGFLIIRDDTSGDRTLMVLGEGLVFAAILVFAFIRLNSSLNREIKLIRKEKNFMLAVSHELKTPIAAIKLSLDTLKRGDLDVGKHSSLLHHSSNEIRRLQSLTDNILLASQLDQFESANSNQKIELSNVLIEECKRFELYSDRKIITDIEDGILILADVDMVRALISNLIDNALKYSPKESRVCVNLKVVSNHCKLMVSDEGVGIPDAEKDRIFERFYRSADEITRSTMGTGIGLYIVKSICKLYQFKIQVEDNSPKGSIFIVQFTI